MKTAFRKSFLKDIQKTTNPKLKNSIREVIQHVEDANDVSSIKNLKKLSGYKAYYRIRLGDFRIGLEISNNTVTFVTFDNRKDIYKKFP